MQRIEVKSGIVYFYGNPAGYFDADTAVVDTIFQSDELIVWLMKKSRKIEWKNGVFDRLSTGKVDKETGETKPLKDCRIWQLKAETDPLFKFIGYSELIKIKGQPPALEDYKISLDFQSDTEELDRICGKFDENPDSKLVGGKVNLSDIIEVFDSGKSEYYYADRKGFVKLKF